MWVAVLRAQKIVCGDMGYQMTLKPRDLGGSELPVMDPGNQLEN